MGVVKLVIKVKEIISNKKIKKILIPLALKLVLVVLDLSNLMITAKKNYKLAKKIRILEIKINK